MDRKIEIGVGIALLFAAVAVGHAWLEEHDARIRAEIQVAATQKSFDEKAAELKQVKAAQATKDSETQAAVAKLAQAAAAQKTPTQIVKWLPMNVGQLPAPIKSSIAAPTPQNPSPDAVFQVPAADLTFLRDQVAKCQENALALPNAISGLTRARRKTACSPAR